jgi:hypothetical protein
VLLELVRERGATLEDIFVRLTTHDVTEGPAGEPAEGPIAEPASEVPGEEVPS